jgi:hypothetical protein
MTTEQVIHDYFWHLLFLLACAWYWGFKAGEWWQEEKTKEHLPNDDMWW